MLIEVAQCEWGDARLPDIEALLTDVASHVTQLLREPGCRHHSCRGYS